MRVGGYHHTPAIGYGAQHRGRANSRNRAGGEAEASGSATDEEKKNTVAATATEETEATQPEVSESEKTSTEEQPEAEVAPEAAEEAAGEIDDAAEGVEASEEEESVEETEKADETTSTEAAKKALADLKKEFKNYLDSLVKVPGLAKAPINVTISDAAFEKMLADPDYKKEVESKFRNAFMNLDWLTTSPTYVHMNVNDSGKFTATPYVDSYGSNYATETKNSFWSQNTDAAKSGDGIDLDDQQKLFEMLRSQTREEKMLFKQQLLNQYRVSMLSFLNWNQSGSTDGGSLSSLI